MGLLMRRVYSGHCISVSLAKVALSQTLRGNLDREDPAEADLCSS